MRNRGRGRDSGRPAGFGTQVADSGEPTISDITNDSPLSGGSGVVTITFRLSDDRTPAGAIVVTATSNNQGIITNASISIARSGNLVTITGTATSAGTVTITINCRDAAGNTVTDNQNVQVNE